jgi:K+-transporting ATPase ATPase C chain
MMRHLRANLMLLGLTVLICSILYPAVLWAIGQTVFPGNAQGSLIDGSGKPTASEQDAVGSLSIAQPFTGDEYFRPRPSAVSYNAAATGGSNWAANNPLLRDRVARILGPIVKYRGGPNKGKLVGPDIEEWFRKDQYQGKPGIVVQWAQAHGGMATAWVKADALNGEYVTTWQQGHATEVAKWIKEHPETQEPKPEDLAGVFFESYSREHPGTWPSVVERKTADGKTEKRVEPVKEGSDIQSIFFDMWLLDHPKADLEPVPADMVMASGSGMDPHITLKNARYQLDRVAGAWAEKTRRDPAQVQKEIDDLLRQKAAAPLGGLVGVELVNVLEVNLALRGRYGEKTGASR